MEITTQNDKHMTAAEARLISSKNLIEGNRYYDFLLEAVKHGTDNGLFRVVQNHHFTKSLYESEIDKIEAAADYFNQIGYVTEITHPVYSDMMPDENKVVVVIKISWN